MGQSPVKLQSLASHNKNAYGKRNSYDMLNN